MVVFDMFPSAKVKDLLQIMSPGGDGVDTAAGATVPTRSLHRPSHDSLSGKACLLLQFYHGVGNGNTSTCRLHKCLFFCAVRQICRLRGGIRSTGFLRRERTGNGVVVHMLFFSLGFSVMENSCIQNQVLTYFVCVCVFIRVPG